MEAKTMSKEQEDNLSVSTMGSKEEMAHNQYREVVTMLRDVPGELLGEVLEDASGTVLPEVVPTKTGAKMVAVV